MHGLHSVSPANNDPSDVLERRSSNSLLGRMEKMHQPWSEVVRAEERLFKFGQEDSHNLSDSGRLYILIVFNHTSNDWRIHTEIKFYLLIVAAGVFQIQFITTFSSPDQMLPSRSCLFLGVRYLAVLRGRWVVKWRDNLLQQLVLILSQMIF